MYTGKTYSQLLKEGVYTDEEKRAMQKEMDAFNKTKDEYTKRLNDYNQSKVEYSAKLDEWKKIVSRTQAEYNAKLDDYNKTVSRDEAEYNAKMSEYREKRAAIDRLKDQLREYSGLDSASNELDAAVVRCNEATLDLELARQKHLKDTAALLLEELLPFIFNQLPRAVAVAQTDADGKCVGKVPKPGKYAIAAQFSRSIGATEERTYWFTWVDFDNEQSKKIMLNNENTVESDKLGIVHGLIMKLHLSFNPESPRTPPRYDPDQSKSFLPSK
jgi:hypothetical protein